MAANKVYWWDAPKGFKAVQGPCSYCYFFDKDNAPCEDESYVGCLSSGRIDQQYIYFVKRTQKP